MKYMVGLQKAHRGLLDCILENRQHIYEVYFSWGEFPNGRSNQLESGRFTPWELQDIQRAALGELSAAGVKLNLLFNANCYGEEAQARSFFHKVGTVVEHVGEAYGLQSVTTTSPLIAKFLKNNFPGLEVRASVNMEIGTVEAMDYLSPLFDSYYMQRELNRDFAAIEKLHSWCGENGKQLFLLANSGCLNHCPARNFHDNLVAHESRIAQMDNAYDFHGLCREFLKRQDRYKEVYAATNFIRPEDMAKYEPYFTAAKLATRVHKTPELVVNSYIRGKYSGDLLRLLEPAHSIYPWVLENGDPPRLVNLDEMM